ncbi:hypothetical protein [Sphingobium sp. B11D3A]|uniref:hypothetical protein n=1 Tax=Sphingobium sp. B11D3A TaxID=2940574 RepID=UPI002224B369|nr:hypothetical protein [Sphingobium sp. B11D3A]MCW2392466.1 hypothetical protein [Sphingobium sp. B11D3A]
MISRKAWRWGLTYLLHMLEDERQTMGNPPEQQDRAMAARLAYAAALACASLALAYVGGQLLEWLGLLGSAGGPNAASTARGLALLLTPSLLLGPAFVILTAALHRLAPPGRRAFSQSAFGFAIMYATLTGLVYFVQLTFVAPRLASGHTAGIEPFLFLPYRSFLFAVDLLGYALMSLATLLAAFALPVGRGGRAAHAALLANGLLMPALALQMFWPWLIWVGALWALSFPAAMLLVARLVRRI